MTMAHRPPLRDRIHKGLQERSMGHWGGYSGTRPRGSSYKHWTPESMQSAMKMVVFYQVVLNPILHGMKKMSL